MKRAKLLAVATAIAFASVSFASEAFAGVTGVIIYLGPGYGYCPGYAYPYPYYSYGYYPRSATGTVLIGEATGGGIGGAGINAPVLGSRLSP